MLDGFINPLELGAIIPQPWPLAIVVIFGNTLRIIEWIGIHSISFLIIISLVAAIVSCIASILVRRVPSLEKVRHAPARSKSFSRWQTLTREFGEVGSFEDFQQWFFAALEWPFIQGALYICMNLESKPICRTEYILPGEINGIPVSAIPDSGSQLNIISPGFLSRHCITIHNKTRQYIRLPNNRVIQSIGSVKLSWALDGENSCSLRSFSVLPYLGYDVVLGSSYLRKAEIFEKHMHKVRRQCLPVIRSNRLRLLDTPGQRLIGSINNRPVRAVPDTGSDFMAMSEKFAHDLKLDIKTSPEYRTEVELVDGSTTKTSGMACGVAWRFGLQKGTAPQVWDFHILQNLPHDVLLSREMLFQSKAFTRYKRFMIDLDKDCTTDDNIHEVNLVKKSKSKEHGWLVRIMRLFKKSDQLECKASLDPVLQELQRQDEAELAIHELPDHEQDAAWTAELAKRQQWKVDRASSQVVVDQNPQNILASGQNISASLDVGVMSIPLTPSPGQPP